jgi:hypothetical protein
VLKNLYFTNVKTSLSEQKEKERRSEWKRVQKEIVYIRIVGLVSEKVGKYVPGMDNVTTCIKRPK